MRLFNTIAVLFYTLIFSVIGGLLIALSLHIFSPDAILNILTQIYQTNNLRLITGLTGLLLILINISVAQITIGRLQKEKTIAFENPFGRVTVSLSAIEDFIKRLAYKLTEIKEIRSNVIASKTGIEVAVRTVLYSDVNIPEATERIQNIIKSRLQDMLGIEETIIIKVHVSKIVGREKSQSKKEEKEDTAGFKGTIEYGKEI